MIPSNFFATDFHGSARIELDQSISCGQGGGNMMPFLLLIRVDPCESGARSSQNIIGFPVAMLASHSSFMLLKNSFSESARMSLEWSTRLTSFNSFAASLLEIQSPVCVPS